MVEFCNSEFWNTTATWESSTPDFTSCFEKSILLGFPCFYLWVFAPFELSSIAKSKKSLIPWSWINISKIVLSLVLIGVEIGSLAANISLGTDNDVYGVDYFYPSVLLVTMVLYLGLTLAEKKAGIQTSGILFVFWLLLAIFGVFGFRSNILFLQSHDENDRSKAEKTEYISYFIFYPCVLLLLVIHCFADKPPRNELHPRGPNCCPVLNASFLNQITFTWFEPLVWKGFRTNLQQTDMWDLPPSNESKVVLEKWDKAYQVSVQKFKSEKKKKPEKKEPFSILPVLLRTFRNRLILGAIFKLIPDILTFASPQIMRLIITFIIDQSIFEWKGYVYAVLLFVVTEIQSILNGQQFIIMYETGLRIRTAVTAAVYNKALKISSSSKKESTVGEIVNLMSVDIQRFLDVIGYINSMWTAPIQIILCVYFLWLMIGPSSLVGLFVMILLIPFNAIIVSRQKILQIAQMKEKDKRLKIINEILNGMKVLKLYAWEPSFIDQVLGIRKKEFKVLKKNAFLGAGTAFLFSCTPFLVAFFMFMTYLLVSPDNILTPEISFVSIALLNILRIPMTILPIIIITSVQALVSLRRVNHFLNSEELDPTAVQRDPKEADPIVVENGTFTWGKEEESGAVLKNINLRVKKGSLVGVVGTVGSGKSSLCLAVLGEMEKLKGTVNVNESVAYVPQQAWIQNATLKDNILFHSEPNEDWYKKVIEACALLPDLAMLSNGDQTEIGEKGINLSGGQKQRVNLARAVYSESEVLLLDDPLSAVDAHVGKHLFEQVIGPKGILKNKTRILVTHGLSYLSQMDEIFVLKEGEIVEQGTLSTLINKKGDFQEFLLQFLSDTEKEDIGEFEAEVLEEISADIGLKRQISEISQKRKESLTETKRRRSTLKRDSVTKKHPDLPSKLDQEELPEKGKLIKQEEMAEGRVSSEVYSYYIKSIGVVSTICTIIFYALTQVFSVGGNILLSNWSDSDDGYDVDERNKFLIEYAVLGCGQAISILLGYGILARAALFGSRYLHNKMLENIMRSPMSFFDSTPLGRIVNRFSKDVDILDVLLPMNLRSFLVCLLNVIATFAAIIYATPWFAVVVVPAIIFYMMIQTIYVKTMRQLKRIESVTRSPIYTHFGESIQGAPTIRAYKKQMEFIKESERRVDFNQLSYFPSIVSYRWLGIRLEVIGNLLTFFAALFAVLSRETVSGGDAGLSISYALSVTSVLNFLVRTSADVETNIVSTERIKEYTETPQEKSWTIESTKPKESWPDQGVVIFKGYSTRYREGLDLVVKNINLHIEPMEKIGIVGRTGAGKSSLTLALFRIIEPAEGTILIDGVDIAKIGLHDLRNKLTIIPQDPVLFSGTLRMNLDPFNVFSDDEVWDALEHSHLKEFASSLSSKLNYAISEGGENLSVGQRQLVCLARALLRKTKMLILDEATAAVDLETDDLIQATIRREFKDCTVITIAHRLNTIMDSTRIVVLDKGEVKEFDTPSNLLLSTSSMFYDMAKSAGLV